MPRLAFYNKVTEEGAHDAPIGALGTDLWPVLVTRRSASAPLGERPRPARYFAADAPALAGAADGGSVISIAQIAAGRMYMEARKLPSIS